MRVGLVVHGQPPELVGGTERLVADLASALIARGDEVSVFSGSIEWRPESAVVDLSPGDDDVAAPTRRVHRHDLFFERWDKVHNPLVERAYLAWLDDFAPDVVHVHHWARLTTHLVRAARAGGAAVVLSLHDLFASCPRYHRVKEDLSFCDVAPSPDACRHCAPRWRFQGDAEIDASVRAFVDDMRGEVDAAHAVVVPTDGHGQRIAAWLGSGVAPVAIPPASEHAASLQPARPPIAGAVATAEAPLRCAFFGHLHELKGLEVLLDAQAQVRDPRRLALHVWGDPPDDATRERLAARAAGRDVTFHGGYRPADLSGLAVDVVVLPTLCAESYSFALDEACALGVPVLGTDLGALRDRATARVELFTRGDAAGLAARLDALADDPARRASLAAEPAPPTITAAEHLARLDEVYRHALAARDTAGAAPDARYGDPQLALRERLFLRLEAGLAELLRSEGWEDVVADLQRRLAEGDG